MSTELNTMTIDELKSLLTTVEARIQELTPKGPCVPRDDFNAEVQAYRDEEYENQKKYGGRFGVSDDDDDFDDEHYINFLEVNVEVSEEERDTLNADVEDVKKWKTTRKLSFWKPSISSRIQKSKRSPPDICIIEASGTPA